MFAPGPPNSHALYIRYIVHLKLPPAFPKLALFHSVSSVNEKKTCSPVYWNKKGKSLTMRLTLFIPASNS